MGMPEPVRKEFGHALYMAQDGRTHSNAKPLKSFGAGVLEVVERHDGGAYRAVYTVRFEEAIYVLHVFQKKSTEGIKTPQRELNVITERMKHAQRLHDETMATQNKLARKGR